MGRTGTLIAIDMILEMAEKEKLVDVSGMISKMRQQRMKMVQTAVSILLIGLWSYSIWCSVYYWGYQTRVYRLLMILHTGAVQIYS